MDSRGYIKLHRQIQTSKIWDSDPFSRGQAWVDMLLSAAFAPRSVRIRGIRVDLQRGQLALSEVEYARRWKWSRGKVRRFLAELESKTVQQIVQQKTNVTSVITILNYEKYQGNGAADSAANGTTSSTANGQQTDTIEEGKEGGEGKEVPPKPPRGDSAQFSDFWQAYPNKKDKGRARKAWKKHKCDGLFAQIMETLAKYKQCNQWTRDGGEFVPMPSTWLNGQRWEDEPDTANQGRQTKSAVYTG